LVGRAPAPFHGKETSRSHITVEARNRNRGLSGTKTRVSATRTSELLKIPTAVPLKPSNELSCNRLTSRGNLNRPCPHLPGTYLTAAATSTHAAMPTQTQHAACSQAPSSATQRARPLLPTCSWFLLMQTRLLLLPAKGVWHRQPRPGGRLRLGAKGTASATAAVRVSSESAGRRWPVAPDAGARAPQGRHRGRQDATVLVRAFGAAGRSSAPTNTALVVSSALAHRRTAAARDELGNPCHATAAPRPLRSSDTLR